MRYNRFAWWLAHRYYNPKSIHERDDLHQTAMLGLLEQLSRHPDSSEALCITAMKSAIWHLYFRELRPKRQAKVQVWDEEHRDIKHLQSQDNTEETVIESQTAQGIMDAVDRLPDEERHLFLLRLNGANLSDEVRRNGWRHSTCKWKLLKARQRLQTWLAQAGITA